MKTDLNIHKLTIKNCFKFQTLHLHFSLKKQKHLKAKFWNLSTNENE